MLVQLRSLGGQVELEVPDNATVGDVRRAAQARGISTDGLSIRTGGQTAVDSRSVGENEVLVATPPKAKQGGV